MDINAIQKRLREIDAEQDKLTQEKNELRKLMLSLDYKSKEDKITFIKKRLDEIFDIVTSTSSAFYKDFQEHEIASQKIQSLQKERNELIGELRLLE